MAQHSVQYFNNLLENIDISIAEHRLIYNEEGRAIDYEFIYVNDAFCRSLSMSKEYVIGSTVKQILPMIEDIWIERYAKVVEQQKPNNFINYTEALDRYFNVHAYPSGKDCFVVSFSNAGSSSPKLDTIELQEQKTVVAMMEYNRILEHIIRLNNVEELLGDSFNTYDEYRLFLNNNVHPDDKKIVADLSREIRDLDESKKHILIRVYHQGKQRYVWVEFTIFVKSFAGDKPEIITIFGQNKDYQFEQIKQKNSLARLFDETKKVANIATFLYDVKSETFEESREIDEFLGLRSLKHIDDFREIVHADDLEKFDKATIDITRHPEGRTNRYRITKYGTIHHLESYLYGQQDDDGATIKVFGILIDRTDEESQRRLTENARNSFERVFNLSPSGMFAIDQDFEITLKNDKFKSYLEKDRVYLRLSDLLTEDYDRYKHMLQEGRSIENVQVSVESNNGKRFYHISLNPIEGNFRNRYLGTVVDITDIIRKTQEIEYLSSHDMLTKLYNRHSFDEMILSLSNSAKHGIIVCDVDGLKLMNDAFGHLDGDQLLIRFAEKLKDIIEDGFIARIGGDEFGVILEDTSLEELDILCSRIASANEEIRLYEVDFSVSIGYSVVHENQIFFDAFREAENRMYRMKLKQRSNRKNKALQSILSALDKRSDFHRAHRENVAKYARNIMKQMGYKRTRDLDEIEQVGLFHDIGKIIVNEQILQKQKPLTKSETKMIHYHSESGYKIITNIIDNDLIGLSVLYHHENYDGSGYPHGIKGSQIPLYSRVIRIADSYDYMVSEDGYSKMKTPQEAVEELISLKGVWYDPELVDAFIEYLKKEGTL